MLTGGANVYGSVCCAADMDLRSETSIHAPVTAPPRSAILPEYEESDEESEEASQETDSQDDAAESKPLYGQHR